MRGSADRRRGSSWDVGFLFEAHNPIFLVHLHHAELLSGLAVDAQGPHGQVRVDALVVLDHRTIVHLVDMIAGQDHDVAGAFLLQGVDVLVHGVRGTLIPVLVDALLGRDDVDEFVQFTAEEPPPTQVDVAVQAHGLVLRQHQHLANAAVEAIRQREIDDPVPATERHGGFGAVASQRLES